MKNIHNVRNKLMSTSAENHIMVGGYKDAMIFEDLNSMIQQLVFDTTITTQLPRIKPATINDMFYKYTHHSL